MDGVNKIDTSLLDQDLLDDIGGGVTPYASASGYFVYAYRGTDTLDVGDPAGGNNLNVTDGTKVILYVPNADVNVNTPINFTNGKAFFMVISGGDINVNANVGGIPDGVPDLEGIFYASGAFNSGIGSTQLHIRGQVVADSFNLKRTLGGGGGASDDRYNAAELFEDDPAQTLMFPAFLSLKTYARQEVAP